jgi:hypothetical protein
MHDIQPYLPELFDQPGTLLYIGARPDACAWLTELAEAGHQITLLEVWPENARRFAGDSRIVSILTEDMRNLFSRDFFTPEQPEVDYTFWWHGPEHILPSQIESALIALEAITKRLIALACPWGLYDQGEHEGNPHEKHLATIYPHFFEWLGYETATDGKPDEARSEIVAWKRV